MRKREHAQRDGPVGSAVARYRLPLLWRLIATNAVVITAAVAAIVFSPATIPAPVTVQSALYVIAGLLVVLVANLVLLRQALGPLRLTELMRRIDLLEPGQRIPVAGDAEVVEPAEALNEMLERLENERRDAASRKLRAEESRLRLVVQDDGVGMSGAAADSGLNGMRERAMLIGARLSVPDRPGGGVEVDVPRH